MFIFVYLTFILKTPQQLVYHCLEYCSSKCQTSSSQYLMFKLDFDAVILSHESQTKRHSNFIFQVEIPLLS